MGSSLSVVLAGAALVSVAMPMSKRVIRPLARKAARQAYKLSESVTHLSSEWKHEWQELLNEARSDNSDLQSTADTVISKAWREPGYEENPVIEPNF